MNPGPAGIQKKQKDPAKDAKKELPLPQGK
jgi:hypothetical protein